MSRLVEIFKKIVTIDSPTGNEKEMADFLVAYFSKRNIFVEKDKTGNIFIRIAGEGEPLLIAAHIDTVEPGRRIIPIVSGDVIRSHNKTILGADNKSTIAVILEVIERLKNKSHRPLEILFTIDEENENNGAKLFDYSKLKAKKGLIADIALPIGTIVLASPAYMRFDIELIGKGGHAGFPEKAKSIVSVLGNILSEVKIGKLDKQTILNIGIGTFGNSRSTISGTAILKGEIRSFDEVLLHKHTKSFLRQVRVTAKRFNIQTKIYSTLDNPAYVFKKEDAYVQKIAALLSSQNVKTTFVNSWSVSDANIFNTKGLQVINIGDGTRDTHTVNESIKISEMEKLVNIFQTYCIGGDIL